MSQRALVCLSVLGVVIAAGCRTTVQLADPPTTAPASGAVGNRPPIGEDRGCLGPRDLRCAAESAGQRLRPGRRRGDAALDGDGRHAQRRVNGADDVDRAFDADLADDHARVTDSSGASSTDTLSVDVQAKP